MFRNRELKVQMVKTPKQNPATEPARPRTDPLLINAIVRQNVRDAALLVGVGFTLKKVLDTCSEVAIIAAKANIK